MYTQELKGRGKDSNLVRLKVHRGEGQCAWGLKDKLRLHATWTDLYNFHS